MGNRALENRVKELKAIEEQQKALTERAEKIKEEIKKDMQAKGKDEIKVGNFVIRFKEVITKRFDTKAFAEQHTRLYEAFAKPQSTMRFSIS